jgi:hypothetical protein
MEKKKRVVLVLNRAVSVRCADRFVSVNFRIYDGAVDFRPSRIADVELA